MQGQWVTGRMLAGLAEAYVSAINAHAVPSIGNAWDGVTKVECAVSGRKTTASCKLCTSILPSNPHIHPFSCVSFSHPHAHTPISMPSICTATPPRRHASTPPCLHT